MARRHGINANQVFHWRKLYRAGLLIDSASGLAVGSRSVRLLPVTLAAHADDRPEAEPSAETAPNTTIHGPSGAAPPIELFLAKGQVRIVGAVDPGVLRAVLECLLRSLCELGRRR